MPGKVKRVRKGFVLRSLVVPDPGVKRQERCNAMKRRMRQRLESKVKE